MHLASRFLGNTFFFLWKSLHYPYFDAGNINVSTVLVIIYWKSGGTKTVECGYLRFKDEFFLSVRGACFWIILCLVFFLKKTYCTSMMYWKKITYFDFKKHVLHIGMHIRLKKRLYFSNDHIKTVELCVVCTCIILPLLLLSSLLFLFFVLNRKLYYYRRKNSNYTIKRLIKM